MLETALSELHSPSSVQLLVEAVYWLESVCAMELQSRAADNDTSSYTPSHLLKNAGLAHMHLVRTDALKDSVRLPTPKMDFFQSLAKGTVAWPTDGRQATIIHLSFLPSDRSIHSSIHSCSHPPSLSINRSPYTIGGSYGQPLDSRSFGVSS